MTIKIPHSWNEIYLPQFEAGLLVEQCEYDDQLERMVDWIAAVTGSSRNEIESLPITELTRIYSQLNWVKNPELSTKIPHFFFAGGKLFEVCFDVFRLTGGQYAEICTWMKDDGMFHLDQVMASVTIERKWWLIKGKYDGSTHAERAAIFRKHLSLAVIYPLALFFSLVYTKSMLVIQDYSLNQLSRANRALLKELRRNLKEQETS